VLVCAPQPAAVHATVQQAQTHRSAD
jgi:hypothetical protein